MMILTNIMFNHKNNVILGLNFILYINKIIYFIILYNNLDAFIYYQISR